MKRTVVIHYHEINLKGNNRGWFEAHLQDHITSLLKGVRYETLRKISGRMIIELFQDSPIGEITRRLSRVFGIANFVVAWEVAAEMKEIKSCLEMLIAQEKFESFKMEARRGTKDFPLNSQQLNEQLGSFVQERTKAKVRLSNPDSIFFIEIVENRAFLYLDKIPGTGGLPSKTGGKVTCLLSSGVRTF